MSIFGGLDRRVIEFITSNLAAEPATQNEIRNFLMGRVTTVSHPEEFGTALKQVTSEIAESSGNTGIVSQVMGAIDGGGLVEMGGAGIVIYKGLEIIRDLSTLLKGTSDEQSARNQSRENTERTARTGVVYPPIGPGTADPAALADYINKYVEGRARSEAKSGKVPKARTFRGGDPEGGFRNRGAPVSDDPVVIDIGDGGPQEDEPVRGTEDKPKNPRTRKRQQYREPLEDIELGEPVGGRLPRDPENPRDRDDPPEIYPPLPLFIRPFFAGRRPGIHADDEEKPPPERTNPGDNTANDTNDYKTLSQGWLRPEFNMIGTDFFDKQFKIKSMNIQNEEWTEYNFVPVIDKKNAIEIDNLYNDMVRFREPLFYPKYQPPLPPPTKAAYMSTKTPMLKYNQLYDPFKDKFDGADMGKKVEFTYTYNRTPFDINFRKLKIYNP